MVADYIMKILIVSEENNKSNLQRLIVLIPDQCYYLRIDSVYPNDCYVDPKWSYSGDPHAVTTYVSELKSLPPHLYRSFFHNRKIKKPSVYWCSHGFFVPQFGLCIFY